MGGIQGQRTSRAPVMTGNLRPGHYLHHRAASTNHQPETTIVSPPIVSLYKFCWPTSCVLRAGCCPAKHRALRYIYQPRAMDDGGGHRGGGARRGMRRVGGRMQVPSSGELGRDLLSTFIFSKRSEWTPRTTTHSQLGPASTYGGPAIVNGTPQR